MRNYARLLARLGTVLLPGIVAMAQNGPSLSGSYGFLGVVNQVDSAGSSGAAIIGILTFDGAGGVSGTGTLKARDGRPQDAFTGASAITGTYTTNPDGTGNLAINFTDFGFSQKFAMVVTDGGKVIQFVDGLGSTNNSMGVSPAFQGGPASLSGALPAAFFFPGAAGNIPLTLARTFSDGPSVYNLIAPATANGTVPCPDGSTGKWTASVFG